jgi:hypothetical protein
MKCNVSVTFEYATRPPDTVKVAAVEAAGPQTIAARALREAKRQARPINWSSIVVLLDRLESSDDSASEEPEAEEGEE